MLRFPIPLLVAGLIFGSTDLSATKSDFIRDEEDGANSCGTSGYDNSRIGLDELIQSACAGSGAGNSNSTNTNVDSETSETNDNTTSEDPEPASSTFQSSNGATCEWYGLDEPADSGAWAGNDPSQGHLEALRCGAPPGDTSGMGGERLDVQFVANAAPNEPAPPPPPPDPAVLAAQAIGSLKVPAPSIGAGPDRTKLAVNLWTWLWVDNPGPQSNTVAAGGISVTATATLSSVTWSMGEPTTTGDTFATGTAATVTCQGTGNPPPANYDWKAQPPCGYMFHWRSLKERTGGTGKWPITATTTWDVVWASNTGITGATTLSGASNDAFDVAEYRIVLVQPGG